MSEQKQGFSIGLCFSALRRLFTDGRFRFHCREWLAGRYPAPVTPEAKKTESAADEPVPKKPEVPFDAIRMLSLLQREGRLVDFLMEDISGLPDEQIGAAVKEIHSKCRKTLKEQVKIEPVSNKEEESMTTVEAGFDPSEYRLMGNLKGSPPYSGTVRHRGWKVSQITLPSIPSGQNPMILAPAEIEIS